MTEEPFWKFSLREIVHRETSPTKSIGTGNQYLKKFLNHILTENPKNRTSLFYFMNFNGSAKDQQTLTRNLWPTQNGNRLFLCVWTFYSRDWGFVGIHNQFLNTILIRWMITYFKFFMNEKSKWLLWIRQLKRANNQEWLTPWDSVSVYNILVDMFFSSSFSNERVWN